MLNDGLYSYVYDAEGRQTSAAGVTYTYDGDGRRVKKSSGKLYWYGLGGAVLAETDLSGNNPTEHIYFGGQRVARRDPSGTVYYSFADHLGTTRIITDPAGAIKRGMDFQPFGFEVLQNGLITDNYKFTGLERDTETGNDHTQFRQYAYNFGRWYSPDPLGGDISNPQSLNRYAYVLNRPTNLIDPLGLEDCTKAASPRACWAESYWGLGNSLTPSWGSWDDPFRWIGIPVVDAANYGWIPFDGGQYPGPGMVLNRPEGTFVGTTSLSVNAWWGPLYLTDAFTLWSQLPVVVAVKALDPFEGQTVRAEPPPFQPPPAKDWEKANYYYACVGSDQETFVSGTGSQDQTALSSYWAGQARYASQMNDPYRKDPLNRPGSWEVPQAIGGVASLVPNVSSCVEAARKY